MNVSTLSITAVAPEVFPVNVLLVKSEALLVVSILILLSWIQTPSESFKTSFFGKYNSKSSIEYKERNKNWNEASVPLVR